MKTIPVPKVQIKFQMLHGIYNKKNAKVQTALVGLLS
jgi:hypothetical protein